MSCLKLAKWITECALKWKRSKANERKKRFETTLYVRAVLFGTQNEYCCECVEFTIEINFLCYIQPHSIHRKLYTNVHIQIHARKKAFLISLLKPAEVNVGEKFFVRLTWMNRSEAKKNIKQVASGQWIHFDCFVRCVLHIRLCARLLWAVCVCAVWLHASYV